MKKPINTAAIKQIALFIIVVLWGTTDIYSQHNLYGIWSRKTGITAERSGVVVSQLLTDSQGNTYVCGRFFGTVSLSDNTCILTNSGGYPYSNTQYNGYYDFANRWRDGTEEKSDGFVTKYDNNGNWVWTVTLTSNVIDNITSMVLSVDESSLIFLGAYGDSFYSTLTAGTPSITYGNGTKENIEFNTPTATYYNYCLVKIGTSNGAKQFRKYLGYGREQERSEKQLRDFSLYATNQYIYLLETSRGSTPATQDYFWYTKIYDFNGNAIINMNAAKGLHGVGNAQIYPVNKTRSNKPDEFYTVVSYCIDEQQWPTYLAKVSNEGSNTFISYISNYESPKESFYQYYRRYGIINPKLDINKTGNRLFLVGHTLMNFTFKYDNTTLTNAGGEDGIIICYDPTTTSGQTTNVAWLVNLRAPGDQRIWDCQFDNTSQTLRVVGYIDENMVNFNPLGTAMNYKATNGKAVFYAVYNTSGICQKVEIMDAFGDGDEMAQAIGIRGNEIILFGTFSGSPFQPSPAGRLTPMRTTDASTFLAKYSILSSSTPAPRQPGSFSAANNIVPTYGAAYHNVMNCISLGPANNAVTEAEAGNYVPGYSATGTKNPNYDGILLRLTPITPVGGCYTIVQPRNNRPSPAYLAGWIDFNENGVFDEEEVSTIRTIPPNTSTTDYELRWERLPPGTKPKLNTYMRIRLSSEILDGTWGAGDAADGEVEDYAVSLSFMEVTKTVDSNIGCVHGTTLFTVKIKNHLSTRQNNIVLKDHLSAGWEILSINVSSGTSLSSYNLNTQDLDWTIPSLAPDAEVTMYILVKSTVAALLSNTAWINSVNGVVLNREERGASVNIETRQPPATPSITATGDLCSPQGVTLTASGTGTFQWYLNNAPIAGAINPTYTATTPGDYRVTVSYGGCTSLLSPATTLAEDCAQADDDYATVFLGESVTIDVLANDNTAICSNITNTKIAVSSGGTSEAEAGYEIEKSFDGDMSTMYHSRFNNATQFPVILEYSFTNVEQIDYLKYYPRTSGINGIFSSIEVWVSTQSLPDYIKYGDYDFQGTSTPSEINFPTGIKKPKSIIIVINSGLGGYVSCAEMEFYKRGTVQVTQESEPALGTASFNPDGVLKYKADKNKWGIDSVDYSFICNGKTEQARVYIAVIKTASTKYFACPTAGVTLGVESSPEVTYNWYNSANILINANSTSINVTKDNTDVQTWYVEPKYNGVIQPRHQIDLYLSDNCGVPEPVNCAKDGRILFREDFGGNNPDAPRVSSQALPQGASDYPFSNININEIQTGTYYSLVKYNINGFGALKTSPPFWHTNFSDVTNPNDTTRGYFMIVEAGRTPVKAYETTINNLCHNTRLNFSAQITNMSKHIPFVYQLNDDPILKFELFDQDGNNLITYVTGKIPRDEDGQFKWRTYGIDLVVPPNVTSIRLKISSNHTSGWQVNAFAIDNIEIRLCVPPVAIYATDEHGAQVSEVCENSFVQVQGQYDDDGVFGSDLLFRYEFKPLNGQWTALVEGPVNNTNQPIETQYNIPAFVQANEGYYRIRMGNTFTINNVNCYAVSDSVYLGFKADYPPRDIRIQLCPQPPREIALTQYVDTVNMKSLTWNKLFINSPEFIPNTENTTGKVNSADFVIGTYTYQYIINNGCNDQNGKLYITPITDNLTHLPPDTVLICYEVGEHIQVNQIMGIEAGGTIELDGTSAADAPYLSTNASGGLLFNGKNAYIQLGTNNIYKGSNVRIVKFKYTPANNSCIGSGECLLTLILTPEM